MRKPGSFDSVPCLCSLLGFWAFVSWFGSYCLSRLQNSGLSTVSFFFIDWRCENQIRSHIHVLHTGVGLRFLWTVAHIMSISVRTETRGCVVLYVPKILLSAFRTSSRYTEMNFPLMFYVTLRLHLPHATCVLHVPSISSLIIFGNEYIKKKFQLLFHFLQVLFFRARPADGLSWLFTRHFRTASDIVRSVTERVFHDCSATLNSPIMFHESCRN